MRDLSTSDLARVKSKLGGLDATAKDARAEAKLLRQQAPNQFGSEAQEQMRRDADLLERWATQEETRDREFQQILDKVSKPKADASPAAGGDAKKPPQKKATRKRRATGKRRSSRTGRAVRGAALEQPDRMVASTVADAGSIFWTVVLGTAAVVLLALLVRNPERATGMIGHLSAMTARVAYPTTVFGDVAAAPKAAAPGTPTPAGGTPAAGRLVPLVNRQPATTPTAGARA